MVGISVGRSVWVTTNCCFMNSMHPHSDLVRKCEKLWLANTAWSTVLYITIANIEVCCTCCYSSVYIFIILCNKLEALIFVMLQWVTFIINMLCWNCKYRSHTQHYFLCTLYVSSFIVYALLCLSCKCQHFSTPTPNFSRC